jgi:hypothetical protein
VAPLEALHKRSLPRSTAAPTHGCPTPHLPVPLPTHLPTCFLSTPSPTRLPSHRMAALLPLLTLHTSATPKPTYVPRQTSYLLYPPMPLPPAALYLRGMCVNPPMTIKPNLWCSAMAHVLSIPHMTAVLVELSLALAQWEAACRGITVCSTGNRRPWLVTPPVSLPP